MNAEAVSQQVEEAPTRLLPVCSHCGFPLTSNGMGLRHYGTHVAHQEYECLRLLHAEIDRLREELIRAVQALPESQRHAYIDFRMQNSQKQSP